MRAIIINSEDRTVTETEIDGSLETLKQIVGGFIEFVADGLDGHHHCYVNEEGLLNNPQHFFRKNGHYPLLGNGVILGSIWTDGDENEADCTLPIDWVKEHVIFVNSAEVDQWSEYRIETGDDFFALSFSLKE